MSTSPARPAADAAHWHPTTPPSPSSQTATQPARCSSHSAAGRAPTGWAPPSNGEDHLQGPHSRLLQWAAPSAAREGRSEARPAAGRAAGRASSPAPPSPHRVTAAAQHSRGTAQALGASAPSSASSKVLNTRAECSTGALDAAVVDATSAPVTQCRTLRCASGGSPCRSRRPAPAAWRRWCHRTAAWRRWRWASGSTASPAPPSAPAHRRDAVGTGTGRCCRPSPTAARCRAR